MTDFLDEKRREISNRLKELKPLAEEYSRLEAAASALSGMPGGGSTGAAKAAGGRRRGPGRPRGSVSRTASGIAENSSSVDETPTARSIASRCSHVTGM